MLPDGLRVVLSWRKTRNIFIYYNIYIINTSKSCRLFECKEWHHINKAIIITNTQIQVMHDPTVILKIQAIQNTV